MNFLSWLFRRDGVKMSSLELMREIYGRAPSKTGISVTWANALEVATVLRCVQVIANGICQVPWRVYQETPAGRQVAPDHPLNRLLYHRPNRWQTAYEFREQVMFHVLLTGNAFVWKGMVGSRRELRRLEAFEPGRVTVKRSSDNVLTYEVAFESGPAQTFSAEEIWHIRGPSWNGAAGLQPTRLAREAIGLAMATEAAHAEFHRGSARVSGVLSVENTLTKERFDLLAAWLDRHSNGGDRAGRPMILDNAAKFTSTQMTGVDAQHLETRKHQIEEICRAFGVMPIMVGHADKTATYASAEQMFLAHVVHTLAPWYERLEATADVHLLSEADLEAGFYTKFTPNALMRGAARDRAEFYSRALGAGGSPAWMTQNEVRSLEEFDRMDGGDELFAPPAAAPPAPPVPENTP